MIRLKIKYKQICIFHTKHGRPIMPVGVNSFLKNIEMECESKCYTMHSSGKNSLAVGLSPYIFP